MVVFLLFAQGGPAGANEIVLAVIGDRDTENLYTSSRGCSILASRAVRRRVHRCKSQTLDGTVVAFQL